MRFLVLTLAIVPGLALGDSYVGHWVGKVKPDRVKLLAGAKEPLHRKLLNYTCSRLEQCAVTLDLVNDGNFTYIFDDGYAPDRQTITGSWKVSGTTLLLTIGHDRPFVEKLPIADGGKHILTNYNDVEGVPIIFSRG